MAVGTGEDVETKRVNTPRFGAPRKFDPSDHPRDRRGRFIDTGAEVDILGGAHGVVLGQGAHGRIQIRLDDGTVVERHRNYLTVTASSPEVKPDKPAPASARDRAAALTAADHGQQAAPGGRASAGTWTKREDGTWTGPDGARATSAALAQRGVSLLDTDPETVAETQRADADAANRNPDGSIRRYGLGQGAQAPARTFVDPEREDAEAPGPVGTITTDDHGVYTGPLRQIANRTRWPSGTYTARTPEGGLVLVSIDRTGGTGGAGFAQSRRVRISDLSAHTDLDSAELAELRSAALAAIADPQDPAWARLRDLDTPAEGGTPADAEAIRVAALTALGKPANVTGTGAPAADDDLDDEDLAALRASLDDEDTAETETPDAAGEDLDDEDLAAIRAETTDPAARPFADVTAWRAHALNPPDDALSPRNLDGSRANLAAIAGVGDKDITLSPGGGLVVYRAGRGDWRALDAWTGLSAGQYSHASNRADALAVATALEGMLGADGRPWPWGTPRLSQAILNDRASLAAPDGTSLGDQLTATRARVDRELGKPDSLANNAERENAAYKARQADAAVAAAVRAERIAAEGLTEAELSDFNPGDYIDITDTDGTRFTGTFLSGRFRARTEGGADYRDRHVIRLAGDATETDTPTGRHSQLSDRSIEQVVFVDPRAVYARRELTEADAMAQALATPTVRRDGGYTFRIPNGTTVAVDATGRQIPLRADVARPQLARQDGLITLGVLDDTGHLTAAAKRHLRANAVDDGENYPGENEDQRAREAADVDARAAIPTTTVAKLVRMIDQTEASPQVLDEARAELTRRGYTEDGNLRAGGQADLDGAQPPSDALLGQRVFYRTESVTRGAEPSEGLVVGTLRYNALAPGEFATYYLETRENSDGDQRAPIPVADGDYVAVAIPTDPRMAAVIEDNQDESEFTTPELNAEITRLRAELADLWSAGVRIGAREFDNRAARVNALGEVVDARDPDEDITPRQVETLPFDENPAPEPDTTPLAVKGVRAATLKAGDRVVMDGSPAEITSVEVDGERVALGLRRGDGTAEDVDLDGREVIDLITETTTARPTPARAEVDTPSPDDPSGGDTATETTAVITGADLAPGQRLVLGGRTATVLRVRTGDPDIVEATLRFANGEEEARIPFGRGVTLDLATEPNPVEVTALPAPDTATSRPVLYTYQRRNIVALNLDDPDTGADPSVQQAAARVRARQPLSAAQSDALAAALRAQGSAAGVRPARARTMARAAAAFDAASAQARGLPAPEVPVGTTVTKTHVGGLTVGDQVGLPNPDGTAHLGRVSALRPMMGGRLVQVTVADGAGSERTRILAARTDAYVLPDLPEPVPVAPARTGPEHIHHRDLRVGDKVRWPADPAQLVTVTAITPGDPKGWGEARTTRVNVTFDPGSTRYDGRPGGTGNAWYPANNEDVPSVVRVERGPASAEQGWDGLMAVEKPTAIKPSQLTLGDRIEIPAAYTNGPQVGYVEGIDEAGVDQWLVSLRNDYGQIDTIHLGEGPPKDSKVNRLVAADQATTARLAQMQADRALRKWTSVFAADLATAAQHIRADISVAVRNSVLGYRPLGSPEVTRDLVLTLIDRGDIGNRLYSASARSMDRTLAVHLTGNQNDAALMAAAAVLSEQTRQRSVTNLRASIAEAHPLPQESERDMVERVLNQHRNDPPVMDLMSVASSLARLRANLAAAAPEAGADTRVPVTVPALPEGTDLKARMAAYRAALPRDLDAFAKTAKRTTVFAPTTLEALEAGEVPELVEATNFVAATAADYGPDADVLARLAIVRAAGADLDGDYQRRLGTAAATIEADKAILTDTRAKIDEALTTERPALDEMRGRLRNSLAVAAGFPSYRAMADRTYGFGRDYDVAAASEGRAAVGRIDAAVGADPEFVALRDRIVALQDVANEVNAELRKIGTRLGVARREAALSALSAVREMGGVNLTYTDPKTGKILTERSALVKAMRFAESSYPREWLEKAKARGPIGLSRTTRGNYEQRARRIKLSEDLSDGLDGTKMARVATHELGHDMERSVPGLRASERTFLYDRTSTGEIGSRTRERKSSIYNRSKELGYRDEFPEHYTGRDYGREGDQEAWEVLTTGMESLMAGSPYLDDDFRRWLFGTLALV